jgi:HAD superfamily hydrolase (TIGR01509 family)
MCRETRCVECIIFDLDGTIIDTADAIRTAVQETKEKFQLDINVNQVITDTLNVLNGRKSKLNFLRIAFHYNFLSWKNPLKIFKIKNFYQERFSEYTRNASLVPGAFNALKTLSDNFRLAVVTARTREWTERVLHTHGISSYFEVVVTTDEVKKEKPDPASLVTAIELLGTLPQECVYVGDLPSDMLAGKRAHVKTVGILTGLSSEDRLERETPDWIVGTLDQLVELFSGFK